MSRYRLRLIPTLLLSASLPAAGQHEEAAEKAGPPKKADAGRTTVLVVVGAEGAEEFGEKFREAADHWKAAAASGGAAFESIGLEPDRTDDREKLDTRIRDLSAAPDGGPLWIVLIGHGTFDSRTVKFNVRGPDFTDTDLAGWLKDFSHPLAVINTASSSAPFLTTLAGRDRVVITATKSPNEIFYTRFGEYFADAIQGIEGADLDNDDQVSLLEAFLYSADQVRQFYEKEGRLATEHSLIDDTGDGFGTRPDWFEGVRATQVAKDGAKPDGERAHQFILVPNAFERRLSPEQRARRDGLEDQVRDLVRQRKEIGDDDYYSRLEPLLVEIARIYDSVKEEEAAKPKGKGDATPVPKEPGKSKANPESAPAPTPTTKGKDGKSS